MTLSNDHIIAWVTRPERPKGAKDEVKRPEGPPTRSRGAEGPLTSISTILRPMDRMQEKNNFCDSTFGLFKKSTIEAAQVVELVVF